jgi:hypothetical protein
MPSEKHGKHETWDKMGTIFGKEINEGGIV